jgi:hypothetical protein
MALLISTLKLCDVLKLLGMALGLVKDAGAVMLAYARLYYERGGVEIDIKESRQGLGPSRGRSVTRVGVQICGSLMRCRC